MQFAQQVLHKVNKQIEDLQYKGLKIVQDKDSYCFTSDSVLLANFFNANSGDNVVELCSGSGVISILASKKTNASNFYCFEIQSNLANLCEESLKINNIANIKVYNTDLFNAPQIMQGTRVDVVVVNPPYYTDNTYSKNNSVSVATHERSTNLQTIAEVAGKLLKFGGKFYMVHIASRFAEICYHLVNNKLQPKQAIFIKPNNNKQYNIVLIQATKGAKAGLTIKDLVITDNNLTSQQLQMLFDKK